MFLIYLDGRPAFFVKSKQGDNVRHWVGARQGPSDT